MDSEDNLDRDTDGDDILDSLEGTGDTDADGVPDYLGLDADNDGIPDIDEGSQDCDGDGIIDSQDLDSDNDGVPDVVEAGGTDADGNGQVDNYSDTDGDGLDDGLSAIPFSVPDTDGDGIADTLDLDSDGDGVNDVVEVGGVDANGDGLADGWSDGDGIPDAIDADLPGANDADGDGIADFAGADFVLGDDADGDVILDVYDVDPFGHGFARQPNGEPVMGASLPDENADGVPDLLQAQVNSGFIHTGLAGSVTTSLPGLLVLGFLGLLARFRRPDYWNSILYFILRIARAKNAGNLLAFFVSASQYVRSRALCPTYSHSHFLL